MNKAKLLIEYFENSILSMEEEQKFIKNKKRKSKTFECLTWKIAENKKVLKELKAKKLKKRMRNLFIVIGIVILVLLTSCSKSELLEPIKSIEPNNKINYEQLIIGTWNIIDYTLIDSLGNITEVIMDVPTDRIDTSYFNINLIFGTDNIFTENHIINVYGLRYINQFISPYTVYDSLITLYNDDGTTRNLIILNVTDKLLTTKSIEIESITHLERIDI